MAQLKLKHAPTVNAFNTTLNGSISDTATTIALNSVTGLQNKAGILVIDRQDADGVNTPSKREYIYFTSVSGSSVVLPDASDGRGQAGSTGQSHADGSIVEAIMDVDQYNGIIDSYDAQHNDDGTHDNVTSDTLDLSQTLNVASAASLVGPNTLGNVNLPSTASGYYQTGKPVIKANISDQTEIGRSLVRATRYVSLATVINVLDTNPGNTNWIELDFTGDTSATTFAVSLVANIIGDQADRSFHMIKNGETETRSTDLTTKLQTQGTNRIYNSWMQTVDTGQLSKWSVNSSSGVSSIEIALLGYEEFVD